MATLPYDERLEQLLRTAARVFAEKGYHPTTMRDLSRATGMSLAGIYYYVHGKEELLYLIQRQAFQRVVEGAAGALDAVPKGAGAEDRLRAFVHHHVTFFAEHMSEAKVLSHEAESLTEHRAVEILDLKRRYVDLLESLIETAARGANRSVAAYGLFGMMNWIYTWYDPKGPMPADQVAEYFTAIFLQGVRSASKTARAAV